MTYVGNGHRLFAQSYHGFFVNRERFRIFQSVPYMADEVFLYYIRSSLSIYIPRKKKRAAKGVHRCSFVDIWKIFTIYKYIDACLPHSSIPTIQTNVVYMYLPIYYNIHQLHRILTFTYSAQF